MLHSHFICRRTKQTMPIHVHPSSTKWNMLIKHYRDNIGSYISAYVTRSDWAITDFDWQGTICRPQSENQAWPVFCIELRLNILTTFLLCSLSDQANGGNSQGGTGEQQYIKIDGNMLNESHMQFKLTTPSPMPQFLNVHYICESASRLLFLSMHWSRNIQAFQLLGWVNYHFSSMKYPGISVIRVS